MRILRLPLLLLAFTSLASTFSPAQSFVLELPRPSQRAVLTQRIGITDVTLNYHRPTVNGRKIWGALVPYGKVWRAGANENTTIQFSDPVMIEGQPLAAGTYGLHMIPAEDEWTVIFSRNYTSWGSFTYDEKEDALRVKVKPQPADFHEALTYDFDDLKADASALTLRWEKVAVPVRVSVKVGEVVQASLDKQLRGLAQYTWMSWDDAATYLHDNKLNQEQALKYANKSIESEARFDNYVTKARILRDMGKAEDAKAAESKALENATPLQTHIFARQLQGDKRQDEAFAIFRANAEKHPNEWFVHSGLARIYSSQGNFESAAKEMKLALASAPEQNKPFVEGLVKQLEAKQDINK